MKKKITQLPASIKIGRKTYEVELVNALSRDCNGCIYFEEKVIKILRTGKRKMHEVFWHEVLHAILHDMRRHDLNNEAFVKAFCKRLYQVLEKV
jgi:hypothetical protein